MGEAEKGTHSFSISFIPPFYYFPPSLMHKMLPNSSTLGKHLYSVSIYKLSVQFPYSIGVLLLSKELSCCLRN